MEKTNDIEYYKPNLKTDMFKTLIKNTNNFLNTDYFSFLNSIKDPFLKELIVIIKKYQGTFKSFEVNNITLFDFNDISNKDILNNRDDVINSYPFLSKIKLDSMNDFKMSLFVIPKFLKEELKNFSIIDDILEVEIKFSIYYNSELSNSLIMEDQISIQILNQQFSNNLFFKRLNYQIASYLYNSNENYILGINKFLNYLQNFLSVELNKNDNDRDNLNSPWSKEEQIKFNQLLNSHTEKITNFNDFFINIGLQMKTKAGIECMERAKFINWTVIKNVKLPNKLISNQDEIGSIVDEILNDFELLKKELIDRKSINNKVESYNNDYIDEYSDYEDNDEDEEEDSYDAREKMAKRIMKNPNDVRDKEIIKPSEEDTEIDHKRQKDPKDYKYNANKQSAQSYHIEQILLLSDKYVIESDRIVTTSLELLSISSQCSIYANCKVCKKTKWDAKFILLPNNPPLFYQGTWCPYCKTNMYIIIKPELIHASNNTLIAEIYALNCIIVDYLPSNFEANCTACIGGENEAIVKYSKVSNVKTFYNQCSQCYSKNELRLGNVITRETFITASKYLDYLEKYKPVSYFSNFTTEIKLEDKFVKKYYKVGEIGNTLPLSGTCIHYKSSFRWFRFDCCYKLYPCDLCHNIEETDHLMALAKTCVCGFCSFEQPEANNICQNCKSLMNKNKEISRFWEGGKGQTDRSKMSNKDNHKFKGIGKTIPKKKKNK